MATEDFTFPAINSTSSHFIDSPPLWRSSSRPCSDSGLEDVAIGCAREEEQGKDDEDTKFLRPRKANHNQRKSFSCVESSARLATNDGTEDEKEKMDLLWEDFNEELSKSRRLRPDSDSFSGDDMVALGCVKALTASKTGGTMLPSRRPGMVVIVKVLKKLFALHNSQRTLKRH